MESNHFLKEESLLERREGWLKNYRTHLRVEEQGRVTSVGDGIAWISGLPETSMDDMLFFADGSQAMVFDLSKNLIGAVLLRDSEELTVGTVVRRMGRPLSVPAGDALLGRIVDPLGTPLDEKPPPAATVWQPIEAPSPPIVMRDFVQKPLYSGIKIVDTLIPIGKGQRQLIIGDEGLGRSAVALQAVINQRDRDICCVYVLIAEMRSTVRQTIETLRNYGAMDYTTVVVADASTLPGLQHIAPFAGSAMAEYWMRRGKDVLIVYDNLSNHAKAYRELSLLLRRPPGREAYPGDIFSLHAKLLERATALSPSHGGGSITALPIIETTLGEIAAYIPTNLISITDGQIYLDRALFDSGFLPAIDITLSVSRIGGQAQHPQIKKEASRMKLDYLHFLELEVFTRFGARLEASMEAAIQRGNLLRKLLKQELPSLLPDAFQLAWLIAFNDALFDRIDRESLSWTLRQLEEEVRNSSLTVETPREEWSEALAFWFGKFQGNGTK